MKYVSLHTHSTFSPQDGFGTPDDVCARVADLGMSAVATTEHGNVSSHVKHEKAAKKHGVKPIFGCEMYHADEKTRSKWHLTVLAQDQVGYQNLMRLVTRSWSEGYYQFPTVSTDMLAEHSNGLVVVSGCSSSKLSCALLGGKGTEYKTRPDMMAGTEVAATFREIFDDRYYLEIQAFPELARTRSLNLAFAEISEKLGIPMVATSDVHYPFPEDSEIQKILHTAGRGLGTTENAEAQWEYDVRLTFPTTDSALFDRLKQAGLTGRQAKAAILTSGVIADRCNVILPKAERTRYPSENGSNELIWKWLKAGWKYRKATNAWLRDKANAKRAMAQMQYEMQVLTSKDFVDYFLMVADLIQFAKHNEILIGPARGSAAASVVCWLLRITEINPMLFPTMMFERFIDENREDMPDIDFDVDDARRDEVRVYANGKYGPANVGNVLNYTRYRGKNSIDEVTRSKSLPRFETAKLKEMIIDRPDGDARFSKTIEDTVEMFPKARAIYQKFPDLAYAAKLEGNIKGMGMHAGGLVISDRPLSDICATYMRDGVGKAKRTVSVIAYDKYDVEYLNLIKIDMLGLSTMGMISDALSMVDLTIEDLYAVPLDDPATMAAFTRGDTVGIFQWDGATTALINGRVAPTRFMELADVNAMSRPGALVSGATDSYIRMKNAGDTQSKIHPLMDKYTSATHGSIIYQEQVLSMIRDVGNFPPKMVNTIRRIIGKKMGAGEFEKLHAQFNEGAFKEHGIKEETADRIWDFLIASAGYSFNVAHAVSYAVLAFWCQWLKQHHPVAFYCAQLKKVDKEVWPRLIKDADRHGVKVLGVDLTRSGKSWTPVNHGSRVLKAPGNHGLGKLMHGEIRAGYLQVPGIGDITADRIIAERDSIDLLSLVGGKGSGRPFADWADMARRVKGVGPKTVETIRKFAEDPDPYGIDGLRKSLLLARMELRSNRQGLPVPNFTSKTLPFKRHDAVTWIGYVKEQKLTDAVELEHLSSGKPYEEILQSIKRPDLLRAVKITCYDDEDDPVQIKISRFKYPDFERMLNQLNSGDMILVRGIKYEGMFKTIHADRIMVLSD